MQKHGLCRNLNSFPSLFDYFLSDIDFDHYQKPASTIWNDKGEANIIIEAPGFSKEDVKIESNSSGLTIKGEISNEDIKEKLGERKLDYILKRNDIDPKSIEAKLENGLLEIKLKKVKEKDSKLIEIL